uniref:Uncharacterized protein n=1 Tax=uncultured marine virus TaxID=186617 RepID=A0A0F7L8U8_9VIRU|nr:hypothetical protein [uncultured marine virus]
MKLLIMEVITLLKYLSSGVFYIISRILCLSNVKNREKHAEYYELHSMQQYRPY